MTIDTWFCASTAVGAAIVGIPAAVVTLKITGEWRYSVSAFAVGGYVGSLIGMFIGDILGSEYGDYSA